MEKSTIIVVQSLVINSTAELALSSTYYKGDRVQSVNVVEKPGMSNVWIWKPEKDVSVGCKSRNPLASTTVGAKSTT